MDEILERNDGHGNYFMQDHEGSVIAVLSGEGLLREWYRYDAFGAPTTRDGNGAIQTLPNGQPVSAINNRFMFTGREYVSQFGFYEYRARAYHPVLGRFMSEDPKGFVRGTALGKAPDDWSFEKNPDQAELNLFRYCSNDPLDFVDPMGLFPERDFIAGVGNMVTFGQAEGVAEHFYPGYSATIDKSSTAYRLGSGGGILAGMLNGKGEVALITKAINLPAWKNISVNMVHIAENHFEGGLYAAGKSIFKGLSEKGVMTAIKQAYSSATTIYVQGDRVLLSGVTKTGMTVEMWFNKVTKMVESAYPVTK